MGISVQKKSGPNRCSPLNSSIDKQNITQNLDENITNEQEIHQNNLEENDDQFCNTTNFDNELQNNLEENENNDEKYNIKILNKY